MLQIHRNVTGTLNHEELPVLAELRQIRIRYGYHWKI